MNSLSLPIPSDEALSQSRMLQQLIREEIAHAGDSIPFSRYMEMALYTPRLGYYSGGSRKFGAAGDFVTAPEMSPLFAQVLSQQLAQVILHTQGSVLELGAGSGCLARDSLLTLAQLEAVPCQYFILEVSEYLRSVQLETLKTGLPADLFEKVVWLDRLPEKFNGTIIGNEVLDAIPVDIYINTQAGWSKRGVRWDDGFAWDTKGSQYDSVAGLPEAATLPEGYVTEQSSAACALISSLVDIIESGVLLMIDYGFPAREYYHPQRQQGTLMCHYRHHAHDNPFLYLGLQDITAHVDFSAIATAAINAGAQLEGYVTQTQFLINCGITEQLSKTSPADTAHYLPLVAAAQKLLSPSEMGELFKVIGFCKGDMPQLIGFRAGDKSHML